MLAKNWFFFSLSPKNKEHDHFPEKHLKKENLDNNIEKNLTVHFFFGWKLTLFVCFICTLLIFLFGRHVQSDLVTLLNVSVFFFFEFVRIQFLSKNVLQNENHNNQTNHNFFCFFSKRSLFSEPNKNTTNQSCSDSEKPFCFFNTQKQWKFSYKKKSDFLFFFVFFWKGNYRFPPKNSYMELSQ